MRVLIACEFSGIVRDAFAALGHDAWSCDLLPTERPGQHIQGDVRKAFDTDWDLMIAHPPYTHLASSGARWWGTKEVIQKTAIRFVEMLWAQPIRRICIENPVGCLPKRSILGPAYQIIQPWQFGHGETKATCLWLKNLPALTPSNIVAGREPRIHLMSPSPDRWKNRSRTFQGIANAMAAQWG